jgi:hypothetical protein
LVSPWGLRLTVYLGIKNIGKGEEYIKKTNYFFLSFPKKVNRVTFLKVTLLFILFLIWGFPLSIYRSKFCEIMYEPAYYHKTSFCVRIEKLVRKFIY